MTHSTRPSRRPGFTLVELLVVIAIIGVLSALLTVGLYAAFGTGKDFILKNEVTQVEMALEQFKSTYGCYPPDMSDFSNSTLTDGQLTSFNAFINKAYPRADRAMISVFRQWVLTTKTAQIDQAEALVLFLTLTSSDPRYPFGSGTVAVFNPPAQNSLKSFYEFPNGSLVDADGDGFPVFVQKTAKAAPLVYFDARTYNQIPVVNGTAQVVYAPGYASVFGPVTPYASSRVGPIYTFFSPKSFQLICAGQNGEFGVDLSAGIGYPILNPAAAVQLPRVPESDGDNIASFTPAKNKFDSFLAQ